MIEIKFAMKFFYHKILKGLGHHKGPRPFNAPNSPKKGIKNKLSRCGD
jgi:hypothetical protein